jgi:hypothetical protein
MIHTSRQEHKTKVAAEVLAMIAAAQLAPDRPRRVRDTDERLEVSATIFRAGLDKCCAGHMPGLNKLPKTRML